MVNSLIKLFLLTSILITFISGISYGDTITVSVLDFSVKADTPGYKLIGKGFPVLIGVELQEGDGVTVIDREERNGILRENQPDFLIAIDKKNLLKVGRMISVDYIVTGQITASAKQLTISFNVIETENGAVILQDYVKGPAASYEYLSAAIAKKILTAFKRRAPGSIDDKTDRKAVKNEEALLAFSDAVDAFDRDDRTRAVRGLDKAGRIEPGSRAVRIYSDILFARTTTFRNIREHYLPGTNPSFLGFMGCDQLSLTLNYGPLHKIYDEEKAWQETSDGKQEFYEEDSFARLSYFFPAMNDAGFGMEVFYGTAGNMIRAKEGTSITCEVARPVCVNVTSTVAELSENNLENTYIGGIFSAGRIIGKYAGIGGSLSIYNHEVEYVNSTLDKTTAVAVTAALLIKNKNSDLIFDTIAGYTTEKRYYINTAGNVSSSNYSYPAGERYRAPVYNENTVTLGLLKKQLFLIAKEVNSLYTGGNYELRFIPGAEYRVSDYLTAKTGAEISRYKISGDSGNGMGGILGFTLSSQDRGIELDANFTYREQPCRFIEGETYDKFLSEFKFTRRNLFMSR